MPPRVLVINPWVCDFKLYDEWMHPLGLYRLISLLRHNGWQVDFLNCLERGRDQRRKRFGTGDLPATPIEKPQRYSGIPRKYKRYGISPGDLLTRLRTLERPDLICIGSAMTYWVEGICQTASLLRQVFASVPMVVGGIAASLVPDQLQRIIGDTATVLSGPMESHLERLGAICGQPVPGVAGWDDSLLPALGLLRTPHHGPVLATLGCPLRCSYCASRLLQPRFRIRDRQRILEEIAFMTQTHGVRDFAFYDDALLYKAENHAIPLLHGIARSLPGIRLHSPNGLHARWLDRPVIESMNNAGWETIRLGYETGEKRFRADTGAKTGEADLARCVGSLFEAGFSASQVGVYIMAGLPEQTPEAVLKEIAFIGSLGVMAKPVCISPVPGTPLFGHYRKHYPFLADDPLSQNDTFFITCLPGWGWEAVERIRAAAREANRVVAEAPASPNVQDASLI